jgi:hypothetical protein
MARTHGDPLARFHALWTLEGLDAFTPEIVRQKLEDGHSQVRAAAIRMSESLYKAEEKSLMPDIAALMSDADADVAIPAILTAKRLELPDWKKSLALTGDIDDKRYEGQMIAMATNDDAWIAGVLSSVRNSFGKRAGFVTAEEVARLRAATKDRTQPWTSEELRARLPQPLPQREKWKLTASHAPSDVALAIDGKPDSRYTTTTSQVPGMWLQIELPQATRIGGLELESNKSPGDYPRGYTVELSTDGAQWGKPVATGKGSLPDTVITFPPTEAKFVRLTQTGEQKG